MESSCSDRLNSRRKHQFSVHAAARYSGANFQVVLRVLALCTVPYAVVIKKFRILLSRIV